MQPQISIIVPIYNVEEFLPRCIESILNQTFTDFELILVDDGSPDNSGAICDEYSQKDNRIRTIHKVNEGVSKARNYGLKTCCGKYVTFVDSDDFVEKNWLKDIHTVIKECEDVEIVKWGYYMEMDAHTKTYVSDKKYELHSTEEMLKTNDKFNYSGFLWNSMFKKEILCNLFFDETLNYCEDHIFSYTAFQRCKSMCILDTPYYHYVIHNSNSLSDVRNPYTVINAANKELEIRLQILKYEDKDTINAYLACIEKSIQICYINIKELYKRKEFNLYLNNNITHFKHHTTFITSLQNSEFIPFIIKDFIFKTKYCVITKIWKTYLNLIKS